MTHILLAAVQFGSGDIDGFLSGIAETLANQGYHVRGVLQSRGVSAGECHCADMDLTTIGSRRRFRISQPLGNGSRGCRLNPGALAECAAFLEQELKQNCDLLVLNRFGRGESEGRGFRDLIGAALIAGVPVLTAIRPEYEQPWADFRGEIGCDLPMDHASVLHWFEGQQRVCRAA